MEILNNSIYSCNSNLKGNKVQEILSESVEVQPQRSDAAATAALNLNISEITNSLFLCSATSVYTSTLEVLGINCVINAAVELPHMPLPNNKINYCKINILDSVNENIKEYFNFAADLIHKVESAGGKTLVHCIAGISRSAALCIAYLMKYHKLCLKDSYNYIKLRRPTIRPNCGFFKQLIEYEQELFGNNTILMVHNELLNLEVPDVYDSEYKSLTYFRKKCKNVRD